MTNLHHTHIFTGPTLSHLEGQQLCPNATFHPPVRCGDLINLLQYQPNRIIIIDGFFELTPSIWHKEILYTLEQGIEVIGCASMGALRAAELHTLGMRGMGVIFELYRDGVINDDDEVAVAHYTKELHYASHSEALINIRLTLQKAVADNQLSPHHEKLLLADVKATFYWHRNLKDSINNSKLPKTTKQSLLHWLQSNQINQKKIDAIYTLNNIRQQQATPPTKNYFEPTIQVFNLIKIHCTKHETATPPGILQQHISTMLLILHLLEPQKNN